MQDRCRNMSELSNQVGCYLAELERRIFLGAAGAPGHPCRLSRGDFPAESAVNNQIEFWENHYVISCLREALWALEAREKRVRGEILMAPAAELELSSFRPWAAMKIRLIFCVLLLLIVSTALGVIRRVDARARAILRFFRGAPMGKYAEDFVLAADHNGLDWRLLPAIWWVESAGGQHARGNTFGWKSGRMVIPPRESIYYIAGELKRQSTVPSQVDLGQAESL